MKQRGRKSTAALAVAEPSNVIQLPPPPKHLNKSAADLWRMVMASRSSEMIEPEAYPVLTEYCRSIDKANILANELDKFDIEWLQDDEGLRRYDKLLAMQDRLTKVIASCAVKLRLTPSTRFDSGTAGRVGRKAINQKKPWQTD